MVKAYRRQRKSESILETKYEAQKLAFAPLSFQAIIALKELHILSELDLMGENGIQKIELTKKLALSEYAINTLFEIAENLKLIEIKNQSHYVLTKLGHFLLHDEMTNINMNFVQDICYNGAFFLKESFLEGKPAGLKVLGNGQTIYEILSTLPEKAQKSWFDFDHYYSDDAFNDALPIVFESSPKSIFDIGGNTGKWAMKAIQYDDNVKVTIFDLAGQLNKAKENIQKQTKTKRILFEEINILDENLVFPEKTNIIWMSQFLDCFSSEQIINILKKVQNTIDKNGFIFILEPFWDRQNYKAAHFSLNHISLYFTCMANGNSKMYSFEEMKKYIELANLQIVQIYDSIGSNEYTLLKCKLK